MTSQSTTTDGLSEARHSVSQEREKMIAEAAYYRAEWRGFSAGDPQADWLASEAEVDTLLVQRAAEEVAAEKQSLLQRLEKRINDWDQKLAALTAATRGARDKLGAELHDQIASLSLKRDEAKKKLAALHDLSAQTWQEVRDHTLVFFDDLHSAIERVTARLSPADKPVKKPKNGDMT